MDVEQRVRQYIVENLRWFGPAETLTPDFRLIDNDILDSMAIFEVISFIEAHYDIQIDDNDLVPENFETITAIANLVSGKVAG